MFTATWTIAIALLVNLWGALDAPAAAIPAAGCSSSQIQAAINAASDGDTIVVPSCSSGAWTNDVIMPNSKGLILQGAGAANTKIMTNGSQLQLQTSSARQPIRVTGFTFIHTNTAEIITVIGTAQNWRIDNNVFDDNAITGAYSIRVGQSNCNIDSFNYGVIDNNQFINRIDATSIFVEWARGATDPVACGDWIWSTPAQRGTAQAVYIEDNVFSGTGRASQVVDARWGAKYVLRHNTIHNPWISTHSGCTNGGRDPMWVEIYNNTFTDDGNRYGGSQVEMRSTSGVFFGNTSAATLNRFSITIDHERSYRTDCGGPYGGRADGTRAWDGNAPGQVAWKALGQPGWGPPQAGNMSTPTFSGVFAWQNLDRTAPVNLQIANSNGATSTHLVFGRELFNAVDMASGRLSERPATCNPGPSNRSVYRATDQDPLGATLYVCSSTNTWTEHYHPYTYPHPLRSFAGGGGDLIPPLQPQNLRIQ